MTKYEFVNLMNIGYRSLNAKYLNMVHMYLIDSKTGFVYYVRLNNNCEEVLRVRIYKKDYYNEIRDMLEYLNNK